MSVKLQRGMTQIGKLTVDGLSHLGMSMKEIQDIPENITDAMLNAQAKVVEQAQKKKGRTYGVYRTGQTIGSIRRGKIKRDKWEKFLHVTPQGTNAKGRPNTEVAFINEFGKHGQVPKPFIRDANEECADEAVEAAANVLNNFYSSKGL